MRSRDFIPILTALSMLLAFSAFADAVYPSNANTRIFGTNQGDVGDCSTEAATFALETAAAEEGFQFRLSLFYHHAYTWKDSPVQQQQAAMLTINPADLALLNRTGPWIPDYMWPEDAEGYDPVTTGVRPHVSEAAAIDPEFPNVTSMGYQETFFTFKGGYSNTRGFNDVKAAVRARQAVTLQINGYLFNDVNRFHWNLKTGLLDNKYTHDAIEASVREYQAGQTPDQTIDHSVAVVGYDDSLYAGAGYATPGAFIVRNSWNDANGVTACDQPASNAQEQAVLNQFRLKISPVNLPGYFAIPYQYVLDEIADNVANSGFDVFNMDFNAFQQNYERFATRYVTYDAPYVCDVPTMGVIDFAFQAKSEIKMFAGNYATYLSTTASSQQKALAATEMYETALQESQSRYRVDEANPPLFNFAKISVNTARGMDRLADFYSGKFSGYYCSFAGGTVWPSQQVLAEGGIRSTFESLSVESADPDSWLQFLAALGQSGLADK